MNTTSQLALDRRVKVEGFRRKHRTGLLALVLTASVGSIAVDSSA